MSGFAFLTDDEQLRAVETVIEEAAGRVPVMAGLGETSTSRAIPKAKALARTGARYLSVLPPFYFFAQQEHLIAYFSAIAAAVDMPIVLYDNPVLTKNPIHPETIVELRRRVPNIIAVKESNQDCVNLQWLLALTAGDPGFSVLTGSEFLILVALQMGVHGCVGGLHNLCPHLAVELYDAFRRGDLETARARQQALIDTWQVFTYGQIWGAFDESLRWLGICERATGAPYVTQDLAGGAREDSRHSQRPFKRAAARAGVTLVFAAGATRKASAGPQRNERCSFITWYASRPGRLPWTNSSSGRCESRDHSHLLLASLLHQRKCEQRSGQAAERALQKFITRMAPDGAVKRQVHAHRLHAEVGPRLHLLDLLHQFAFVRAASGTSGTTAAPRTRGSAAGC